MRLSPLRNKVSKEILEYEYANLGSMQKVADKLNVGVDSIYKYMKLYNIPYNKHYKGIYSCNHNIFSEDNEISFYLAGFIAADGSVQNRQYSDVLKICLSLNDKDHLIKIKNLMESNHIIYDFYVKPGKLVKTGNYSSEFSITSEQICKDLLRFNIVQNKTLIYSMPEWLLTHPFIQHFIRGCMDGDGSYTFSKAKKKQTMQLSVNILGTEIVMNQLNRVFINNLAFSDTRKTWRKDKIYYMSWCGNIMAGAIVNFLYKDATIYLDRKFDKIKSYLI